MALSGLLLGPVLLQDRVGKVGVGEDLLDIVELLEEVQKPQGPHRRRPSPSRRLTYSHRKTSRPFDQRRLHPLGEGWLGPSSSSISRFLGTFFGGESAAYSGRSAALPGKITRLAEALLHAASH